MEPFARGQARWAGSDQLRQGIFEVRVSSRTEVFGTVADRFGQVVASRTEFCHDARRPDMWSPHVLGLGVAER